MKITLFALAIAVLIMPQFVYGGNFVNKEADDEFMLLLKYALEAIPDSRTDAHKHKTAGPEKKEKIIITVISDSSDCLLHLDCKKEEGIVVK